MVQTWIYSILLVVMLVLCLVKKCNAPGIILMVMYVIVGVLSITVVKEQMVNTDRISLLAYLFLIICYIVYLSPFFCSETRFGSHKIAAEVSDKYLIFVYIYIICSILYLIDFVPQVALIAKVGNWHANYDNQLLGTEGAVFNYSNRFFWFATQISNYTSLLVMIVSFLYLRNKKHIKIAIIAILIYLLTKVCSAMYVSSRGVIYQTMFVFIGLLAFVFPEINKKTKYLIFLGAGVASYLIIPYIINVTVSRFSSTGAMESVIRYMGHAPVLFNSGIAPINKLSLGKYTTGILFGDYSINQYDVGGTWGTGFYTFVGWMYIDWGPLGVLIIGGIVNYILNKIIRKTSYEVSDLLIIFYYYNFLTLGALVIGPQQIISIIMLIVLYVMIKIFVERVQYKFKIRIVLSSKRDIPKASSYSTAISARGLSDNKHLSSENNQFK